MSEHRIDRRGPRLRTAILFAAGLFVCACAEPAATSDPGLSAKLRVADAQYVEGAPPARRGGPAVRSLYTAHSVITPGLQSEPLGGALDPSARAALVGLRGDRGYWIVVTGSPSAEAPELPTLSARMTFADALSTEERVTLEVRGVDARDRVGPLRTLELRVAEIPVDDGLRITLRWDSDADLDLHVIDPHGVEIWAGNPNSYTPPPPGSAPANRDAYLDGGVLDLDSNAGCALDGRRAERLTYPPEAAPSGTYVVRVATAAMCGAAAAHFEVEAALDGERLARAAGTALPSDARSGTRAGAGRTAFRFVVP